MKKLVYAAIVAFLFVGGLAAGVVHKGIQAQKQKGNTIDLATLPAETPGGLSLADLGAATPTAPATEVLQLDFSSTPETLAAAPTPATAGVPDTGRVFGGGGSVDPVQPSPGGSTGSFASSPAGGGGKKPRGRTDAFGDDFIPDNREITGAGTLIEDPAWDATPTPKKGRSKTVAAAAPTPDVSAPPASDPFDEMPTVDTGGPDPFAATGSSPTPDPFAGAGGPDPFGAPQPMVAMAVPQGGGDLVFGAASRRPALVKVAQKQNGASSTITIELAGSAPYKILQIPKRRQVWIDFEGVEVPGGSSSVGGSAAHVRGISAKFITNSNGGMPYARVIVQLDDGVVQTNERGKEELMITPNRGTGETNRLQLSIGGRSQQF